MEDGAMQWNTNDILNSSEFDAQLATIETTLTSFEQVKTQLDPLMSAEAFAKILLEQEQLSEEIAKLATHTSLELASDMKSQEARARQAKLDTLSIKLTDTLLFFDHWVKGLEVPGLTNLDDDNAKRLFAVVKDLEYSLHYGREKAKHSLSEAEEKLIVRKDSTGIDVVTELYDLIVNDFTYTVEYVPKGSENQERRVIDNQQELVSLVHSSDPALREAAYKALFSPYKAHLDKFFMIYSAVARNWSEEAKLRKYNSAISRRNAANMIPDEVIDLLLQVCSKNVSVFQEYFRLKAKLLGAQKLRRYDIYAPLTHVETKISFADAQKLVIETFEKFSPSFAAKAQQIIDEKHLDSHPRKNKRNGAFCMSITPAITPYVLTNYDGRARDVSTLAHELGHGIHDLYASNHLMSVMHAPLPLCETASTFGEMIVFERLLANCNTNEERISLLVEKIADSYATIIRQNYFVLFERQAHDMLSKGASADELCDAYLNLLKEQFGDSVDVAEEFKYEWAYIPHIVHSPFYCYAYNFGELLSLALYARYKKEGPTFVTTVEEILRAGGSEDPVKLLRRVGVNIDSAAFWQGGFAIITKWITELKEAVKEK